MYPTHTCIQMKVHTNSVLLCCSTALSLHLNKFWRITKKAPEHHCSTQFAINTIVCFSRTTKYIIHKSENLSRHAFSIFFSLSYFISFQNTIFIHFGIVNLNNSWHSKGSISDFRIIIHLSFFPNSLYSADLPSSSSMRSNLLYFATLSLLQGEIGRASCRERV